METKELSLIDTVLLAFATFRISRMVVAEDGPFDVFLTIRNKTHERFGDNHWVSRGLGCLFCVSFWVSFIVLLFPRFVSQGLGVAGLTALLIEYVYGE